MNLFIREQTGNSDGSSVICGYFASRQENRNPGGSLMKPVNIENSAGLDRMATWNEVRCAISISSQDTLPLNSIRDDFLEVDSDLRNHARNLSEDAMWLAIVNEMPDSKSN